jgi:hypothetical protein
MLSYDPKQIPTPATDDQAFLNAILVELRAIRIALQERTMNATSTNTPVVMPKPYTAPKQPTVK